MTPFIINDEKILNKELKKKALNPEYLKILKHKREILQQNLDDALKYFKDLELAKSAKKFRNIANELKLIEFLITNKGKYSDRNKLNDLTGKQWLQHTKSWLIVDGKPNSLVKDIKNHPASFPPSLAEYFISFFTKKEQWVFDPFMGIGSTASACFTTKRNCFGIELNSNYANFTNVRIKKLLNQKQEPKKNFKYEFFNEDSRNALKLWKKNQIPKINFLITSPPYANILKKSRGGVKSIQKQRIEKGYDEFYSERDADLGNISDIDKFLRTLTDIFKNFKEILQPNAYLMIILQNFRDKDGIMRPIAWDFANILKKSYSLQQEFIWCQDQKFMGIWGYPSVYISNVHHHYCLVFRNNC